MSELVSVVLPTHNRAPLLSRAMDSVLTQSHRELELIVVDDGSADGTAEMIEGHPDARVRLVRLPQQRGPAAARNAGLRAARGALVAFQDSDDEWLPGKLERQLRLLRASPPDVGLIVGAYTVHEPQGVREVRSAALEQGGDYTLDLIRGYPLATPLWLTRGELLRQAGGFDDALPCLEDWDLSFRLSRLCRFRAVPERILVKHGHADTLSADSARHLRGLEAIFGRHAEHWRAHPAQEAALFLEIGARRSRHGARLPALAALLHTLRLQPVNPAAWRELAITLLGLRQLRRAAA